MRDVMSNVKDQCPGLLEVPVLQLAGRISARMIQ